MSIVWTRELWQGRELTLDDKGQGKRTRVFLVLSDDPEDTPEFVLRNCDAPALWTPYPGSYTHELSNIRVANETSEPMLWRVTCEYSNKSKEQKDNKSDGKDGGDDKGQTPEDDIPLYDYHYESYLEPMAVDRDGKLVANSAKDPFTPLPSIQKYQLVIVVTKNINEANYNPKKYQDAIGSVNSGPLKIGAHQLDSEQGRIAGFSSSRTKKNGQIFYRTTTTIHVRDKWYIQLLDVGANFIDADNKKKPITKKGIPTKFTALDGAGGILAAGLDPIPITFYPFAKGDWGGLGIL